jgi:hypothetical protein
MSKHKRSNTPIQPSTTQGDWSDSVPSQQQPKKDRDGRTVRPSPIMLSNPLDSPSSDAKSFDEDDMYGSDSDIETISLKPFLRHPAPQPAPDTEGDLVHVSIYSDLLGFSHMII